MEGLALWRHGPQCHHGEQSLQPHRVLQPWTWAPKRRSDSTVYADCMSTPANVPSMAYSRLAGLLLVFGTWPQYFLNETDRLTCLSRKGVPALEGRARMGSGHQPRRPAAPVGTLAGIHHVSDPLGNDFVAEQVNNFERATRNPVTAIIGCRNILISNAIAWCWLTGRAGHQYHSEITLQIARVFQTWLLDETCVAISFPILGVTGVHVHISNLPLRRSDPPFCALNMARQVMVRPKKTLDIAISGKVSPIRIIKDELLAVVDVTRTDLQ